MRSRVGIAAIGVALVLSACTNFGFGSDPTSTTNPGAPSTTTPAPPATGDPSSNGRDVIEVACDDASGDLVIVCEAYDLIQSHYVDPIDDDALVMAAIEGLGVLDGADSSEALTCVIISDAFKGFCEVAAAEADSSEEAAEAIVDGFAAFALDANSTYFNEQELALLAEEQQGQIEGIGALVSPEDETIEGDNKQCSVLSETCKMIVISTIEGAPAEAVGLLRGDVFVKVNGESILGWSVDQLTATVRGRSHGPRSKSQSSTAKFSALPAMSSSASSPQTQGSNSNSPWPGC